jgi:hypothetical protein
MLNSSLKTTRTVEQNMDIHADVEPPGYRSTYQ